MPYREKKNLDIRAYAKERKVTLAEIAKEIGETSSSLSIELRKELSGPEKAELMYAVRVIAERRAANELKGVQTEV